MFNMTYQDHYDEYINKKKKEADEKKKKLD